ncbi:hypothetical protein BDW74DRAFT_164783 [Aspergillus multicolor]|uniref:uncharacterized protein n=1 Tax=Aspergillus multicolor TaxID=41759 RepID=UPI003CCDB51C
MTPARSWMPVNLHGQSTTVLTELEHLGLTGVHFLSTSHIAPQSSNQFNYTSGRWLYNDALRHDERRRVFNVHELKRLAASSIGQKEEDVTMRNSFRFVARIPYPVTQPKSLVIASEVATMDYLRAHDIPVPQLIQGQNLGDVWFELTDKRRAKLVTELVQVESRLFALRFPASGSLHYPSDLPEHDKVIVASPSKTSAGCFCIGPDTSLGLWYGRRSNLQVDRGPYRGTLAALTAGVTKEVAYLSEFGAPLQPFQRLRRETYNYQPQSHLDHIATLKQYLQIAPSLILRDMNLCRPVLRHPDLQPNNIFVTDELEISGLNDWQHTAVLPPFLHCGIPNSLQNHGDGDESSESLQQPALPRNFHDMSPQEQYHHASLYRKRRHHYHYEGDNVTLKSNLITLSQKWTDITGNGGNAPPCPLVYSDSEINECLRLEQAQSDADDHELFEEVKVRERALRREALGAAETEEERKIIEENWIFR